ncbi:MAG: hypothetical protein BWY87_00706 [Deltaproteobacteria bacterium ADurb.Bin510]|nr:MAG: hypothetical protein BWY87_00706 [Deltaproteobacteria bacterium ADurb.Bin510]
MPTIRAFKGLRYNPELSDLDRTLCPPYDVIDPDQAEALKASSPHNCIHLEFPQPSPRDTKTANRYTRAGDTLKSWLAGGVLIEEAVPALYYHEHSYRQGDRELQRYGLIAAVKLDEDGPRAILPHEATHKAPKRDRLQLLNSLKLNTSCIFGAYSDKDRLLALAIRPRLGEPVLNIAAGGERHRLWAITDKDQIAEIVTLFENRPVLIADGHHRYETARIYRDHQRAATGRDDGDQPFDYALMYLCNLEEGLRILPTHRVVRDSMGVGLVDLEYRIKELFNMHPYDNRRAFLKALEEGGAGKIGLYVGGIERYYLLEALPDADLDRYMPAGLAPELRRLDLTVLHSCILEPILGIDETNADKRLTYVSDTSLALDLIEQAESGIVFLLNPNTVAEVMAIAAAGLKMPQKSTYFYPKVPSGLCFHVVE